MWQKKNNIHSFNIANEPRELYESFSSILFFWSSLRPGVSSHLPCTKISSSQHIYSASILTWRVVLCPVSCPPEEAGKYWAILTASSFLLITLSTRIVIISTAPLFLITNLFLRFWYCITPFNIGLGLPPELYHKCTYYYYILSIISLNYVVKITGKLWTLLSTISCDAAVTRY